MSNTPPKDFAPKTSKPPEVPSATESQAIIDESQSKPPNEHETTLSSDIFDRERGISNQTLADIMSNPVEDTPPIIGAGVEQDFGPLVSDESVRSVVKEQLEFDPKLIDEQWLGRGIIEAKPLSMPEMLSIKPKDPNIMFRWVNYKSEEGSRVARHQSMGFTISTIEDIDGPLPMEIKQGAIGIICYDVVLMKIDKLRLLQAYEYNLQKSQRMVSRKGSHDKALETAVAQLKADMTANGVPSEYIKGRVGYFMPNSDIADAITR